MIGHQSIVSRPAQCAPQPPGKFEEIGEPDRATSPFVGMRSGSHNTHACGRKSLENYGSASLAPSSLG